MTPLGLKIRELRTRKGVSQKQMARDIGVSAAYLSALEHGKRGVPSWHFLQRLIGYFNIIWDEAEELQEIASRSQTRVSLDTQNLGLQATCLANTLAQEISKLSEDDCTALEEEIHRRTRNSTSPKN